MVMTTVTVDVDVDVELSEIDDDALIDELEDRGYAVVTKQGDGVLRSIDIERIEHLATCGLLAEARAELIELASLAIGRPL